MSFLSPAAMIIATAALIPPLIALYFLKLRRQQRVVPSTFLWKKAVEDLQVNAPFQRLRRSLLLLLQLMILGLGIFALGVPMCRVADQHREALVLMIDQSASMNVKEADGRTRLEQAKQEAKKVVDNMAPDAKAMVIAFCDRAVVAGVFDSDKASLKARIDSIEPTESTSELAEAFTLAEAKTQNALIASEEAGADQPPASAAIPARVMLFTDGRIEDAAKISVERLNLEEMTVERVGARADNVAIIAMDARRQYEKPDVVQVFATVRNFGLEPVKVDAALYLDDQFADSQEIQLAGAPLEAAPGTTTRERGNEAMPAESGDGEPVGADGEAASAEGEKEEDEPAASGAAASVAFDEISFPESGTVEVRLLVEDALEADNRAWAVVEPPRDLSVLLVSDGNFLLEKALDSLGVEWKGMTLSEYEADSDLIEGQRSRFDVVIFDGGSTERLPPGAYFFWGSVPKLEGFAVGKTIDNQRIFNWDETHPVLRHVAVSSIEVFEWKELVLPAEAASLIDGETSPVLATYSAQGRQFLICAFRIVTENEFGEPQINTYWITEPDFIVFLQNAIQYLASALAPTAAHGVAPGTPVTLSAAGSGENVTVIRPDGTPDRIATAGYLTVSYARTRNTGLYRLDPLPAQGGRFAVNLFNPIESNVAPGPGLKLGGGAFEVKESKERISQPAWPYFLLTMLGVVMLEWLVYNRRVGM